MRPTLVVVAVLLVTSCGGSAGERAAFVTRDSAGMVIAENSLAGLTARCAVDTAPAVRIGGVEDDDDRFLHRVMGAARLSDGRIAVVNQGTQEVRWYDRTGALVGRAGREGSGPGEFRNAFLMYHGTGDTLWVGDYSPWQWHLFSPEMEFVRTARTTPQQINGPRSAAILASGHHVMGMNAGFGRNGAWAMDSASLLHYGPDGTLIDTLLTIPTGRYGQTVDDPRSVWMRPWFEGTAQAEGTGEWFAVATWGEPEVTVYRFADRVTPRLIIRWTTGDLTISDADVAEAREKLANQYPDLDPAMKAMMVDPMLSPQRPVAERFPAVTGLMVARDGRIWVREHARTESATAEWIIFAPTGEATCRATMPRFEVWEIGADYVIAAVQDSAGMETVVEFQVAGPAASP